MDCARKEKSITGSPTCGNTRMFDSETSSFDGKLPPATKSSRPIPRQATVSTSIVGIDRPSGLSVRPDIWHQPSLSLIRLGLPVGISRCRKVGCTNSQEPTQCAGANVCAFVDKGSVTRQKPTRKKHFIEVSPYAVTLRPARPAHWQNLRDQTGQGRRCFRQRRLRGSATRTYPPTPQEHRLLRFHPVSSLQVR